MIIKQLMNSEMCSGCSSANALGKKALHYEDVFLINFSSINITLSTYLSVSVSCGAQIQHGGLNASMQYEA